MAQETAVRFYLSCIPRSSAITSIFHSAHARPNRHMRFHAGEISLFHIINSRALHDRQEFMNKYYVYIKAQSSNLFFWSK
jgi:hypothetical protein